MSLKLEFMGFSKQNPERGTCKQIVITTEDCVYYVNPSFDNSLSVIRKETTTQQEEENAIPEERPA